ncbi:hypothetical protein MMC27_002115 [Xylographa pallens]|nr:hypothetical protein [Xylographa pallens]
MASTNQSTSEILRLFPHVPVNVPSTQSSLKRGASRTQPYLKDVQFPYGCGKEQIARQHEFDTTSSSVLTSSTTSGSPSYNLSPEQWQILDEVADKFSEVPLGVIVTTLELLRSRAAALKDSQSCARASSLYRENFDGRYISSPAFCQVPIVAANENLHSVDVRATQGNGKIRTSGQQPSRYSNASLSTTSSYRPESLFSFISNTSSRSSIHEETGQSSSGRYVEQGNSQKRKASGGEDAASFWSSRKQLDKESLVEQTSSDAKYYTCSDCFKTFTSKSSVTRHRVEVHDNNAGYSCPPAGLTSMTNLGAECVLCSEPRPDVDHFLTVHHFADCHGKAELGSARCFKRRTDFAKHMEIHGVDKDSPAFKRWARNVKNKGAWGCGFCVSTHYAWPQFQQHLRDHLRAGPYSLWWDHSMVIKGLLSQPFLSTALAELLGGSLDRLQRDPSLTWLEVNSEALQAKLEERREPDRAAACAQNLVREAFQLINTNQPAFTALTGTIPGALEDIQHDFYAVQPTWDGRATLDFNMDSPTLPAHVFSFAQELDNFRLDDNSFEGSAIMFNHPSS